MEEQSLMTDFNSFKMVNQCKSSRDNGEFIFREYMAYKLYNFVSPYSMRVQLISIKYVDTEDKSKPYQLYGFIIEPLKEMARRLGGQEIKRNRATYNHLDRMTYVYMTVFQYMIGNTDWSLSNMHNMELIKVPEITKILPVPYDFDYSGFVDTHYAVPFEELPIKDVRQRLYRGNGCSKEEIEAVYQHFSGLKTGIMDYCSQFEHMDEKAKKPMMRFMEEFFETLEHPKKRANAFRRGN